MRFYNFFMIGIFVSLVGIITPAFAIYTKNPEDIGTMTVFVPGIRSPEFSWTPLDRSKKGLDAVAHSVVNAFGPEQVVVASDPPCLQSDLGQGNCISHLEDTVEKLPDVQNLVIVAECVGTATAINYIEKHSLLPSIASAPGDVQVPADTKQKTHRDAVRKIKALVLLGSVVSIDHVLQNTPKRAPPILERAFGRSFPGAVSHVLKYSATGVQSIDHLDQIPRDLPIVIVHAKEDKISHYSQALALYYRLRQLGNPNVFIISIEGEGHNHLLSKAIISGHGNLIHAQNERELAGLNTIYKKFNLPYDLELLERFPISFEDLKQYQPDYSLALFHQAYDELASFRRGNL